MADPSEDAADFYSIQAVELEVACTFAQGGISLRSSIAELWSIYFSLSTGGIVKRGTAAGKKLKYI